MPAVIPLGATLYATASTRSKRIPGAAEDACIRLGERASQVSIRLTGSQAWRFWRVDLACSLSPQALTRAVAGPVSASLGPKNPT